MELLGLLLVIAIVAFVLRSATRRASPPVPIASGSLLTPSAGTSVDNGAIREAADGGWILNPNAPLPLTVLDADRATAQKVRRLLESEKPWNDWNAPELSLLVAQHNLRFKELDAYMADLKARFDVQVGNALATSTEWESANERDRTDLSREFERAAIESLGTPLQDDDVKALLAGPPQDAAVDDALVSLFAGNVELYAFYLQMLRHEQQQAMSVPADAYGRKDWEALVRMGVARRGQDVPLEAILDGMRLKELNELLAGTRPKPYGRIATAVEAARALPDLKERLAKQVAFRELFQVVVPPGIDVAAVMRSFGHAKTVARVIQQTFDAGMASLRTVAEAKADPGSYQGWRIECTEEPMPACAKAVCKATKRIPSKLPPYHVGCTCELVGE